MRRRTFLVSCAATGLAGCGTGQTGRTGDGESPTDTPVDSGSPATETGSSATSSPTPVFPGYETTEVQVTTPGGEVLGSVTAAVADTTNLRYIGLSDTDSLPSDRGMLFVYESVGEHTYVMREMDFAIDIVYADDEGRITRVHHAPEPGPDEDGSDQRYPGRGQYVLEVNYEWTTDHGVGEGDVLQFDRQLPERSVRFACRAVIRPGLAVGPPGPVRS
ncbi:DUF192 domain-containing protein [Halobacteriales archaeon SW_7_68_16]|nr:MAG: DUF192 domain-containing protein [Halobacteriales archaeon SW_7_68_16]